MDTETFRILAINPGSTSTKASLFENEKLVFEKNVFHDSPVLMSFPHVNAQLEFRKNVIIRMLEEEKIAPSSIDAFVGRGGSAHTQKSGVVRINGRLYDDTVSAVGGSEHPAKLGVMLAYELGKKYGKPSFTLDPTNTDEYCELARITGIKGLYRTPHSHVLNQKAVAKFHASGLGRRYEDMNFIVAHIDGGITVAAHERGKMVDGTMGADGEGPFTPTRIGSVPVLQLLDYIDEHGTDCVRLKCSRAGGFVDFFGTSSADAVYAMVKRGDRKAALVWDAMIYQTCKSIGAMAAVLHGKVDAILLTGGLLRFDDIEEKVKKSCSFIAPVFSYPGEMEQEALALPVLGVLRGEIALNAYTGCDVWNPGGE